MIMIKNRDEKIVYEWLQQIGYCDIDHLKDGRDPPDFVARKSGKKIAVETRRLPELEKQDGWQRVVRAIDKKMQQLVREAAAKGFSWTANIEYDDSQSPDVMRGDWWEKVAIKHLLLDEESLQQICRQQQNQYCNYGSRHYYEIQIIPADKQQGYGVVLGLIPSKEGCFMGVYPCAGVIVAPTLTERVANAVKGKTEKVKNKINREASAGGYDEWWLVLVDEILVAPKEALLDEERASLESSIAKEIDQDIWDRLVLVSPARAKEYPDIQSKWSWLLWEDPRLPSIKESCRVDQESLPRSVILS